MNLKDNYLQYALNNCGEKKLIIEEPSEPCKSCPYAEWYELYGAMVYCCDLSSCRLCYPMPWD